MASAAAIKSMRYQVEMGVKYDRLTISTGETCRTCQQGSNAETTIYTDINGVQYAYCGTCLPLDKWLEPMLQLRREKESRRRKVSA